MKWQVKHSESKDAWNIIGTELGSKYKIARVPYLNQPSLGAEYNHKEKQEAYAHAKLIAAAPELLECVLDAISDLSQYMPAGQLDHFKSIVNKTK